jgi:hypothetical protein
VDAAVSSSSSSSFTTVVGACLQGNVDLIDMGPFDVAGSLGLADAVLQIAVGRPSSAVVRGHGGGRSLGR